MEPDDLAWLFELYEGTSRQGPGSAETTRRALGLLPGSMRVERVLDVGCGTGGSTIVLAESTGAHVTAVDIHPPFLATLRARAAELGLADRIRTVVADMGDLASRRLSGRNRARVVRGRAAPTRALVLRGRLSSDAG